MVLFAVLLFAAFASGIVVGAFGMWFLYPAIKKCFELDGTVSTRDVVVQSQVSWTSTQHRSDQRMTPLGEQKGDGFTLRDREHGAWVAPVGGWTIVFPLESGCKWRARD